MKRKAPTPLPRIRHRRPPCGALASGLSKAGRSPCKQRGARAAGPAAVAAALLSFLALSAGPIAPGLAAPQGEGSLVVDLAQTLPAGTTHIIGSPTKEQLGNDLTSGDLNGDGLVDLLVGAHWWTTGGRNIIGRAYGLFGRGAWPGLLDLAQAPQRSWSFTGRGLEARLGNAVATGDLNGDGIDDAVMGSLLADPADPDDTSPPIRLLSNGGAVYVVFGGAKAGGNLDFLNAEPDVYLAGDSGPDGADQLGTALAIDDLNGDGQADLVVSATLRGRFRGAVFGWWGPLRPGRRVFLSKEAADWQIEGAAERTYFGSTLATGELTGDGVPDLVVAAVDEDGSPGGRGPLHVFAGGPNFAAKRLRSAAEADVVILPPVGVSLGSALSLGGCSCRGQALAVGDLSGDGQPDLIAGAPLVNRLAGEVRFLPGPLPTGPVDLDVWPHLLLSGPTDDGRLGWSVAVGDLGGDGQADLVVAAPWADGGGRGDTGLALGLPGPLPASGEQLLDLDATELKVIGPMAQSGLAGMTLRIADTDGDGRADLHLGFPDAAPLDRRSVGSLYRLPGPLLLDRVATPTPRTTAAASPTPETAPSETPGPPEPTASPVASPGSLETPVASPTGSTPPSATPPGPEPTASVAPDPSSTAPGEPRATGTAEPPTPSLTPAPKRLLLPLLIRSRRR